MTLALDATYSLDRHPSGVGVYSREMLAGLPAAAPAADFLFCYRPHRFLRSFAAPLPPRCARRLLLKHWPASPRLFHGLNQRLHGRYRRAVSTFHDLFVLTGDYSTPEFRARFAGQARRAADGSDLVIAVSEFTASQLRDLLHVEAARIRVVHHGIRRIPAGDFAPRREPVILFAGAIQKRKNLERLVQAFEQLRAPEWKLALVGGMGYGAGQIIERIRGSPKRASIELTGYVSDLELERQYARASIFAFPSLDEGFGMPVLEAMSRQLPVVASNRSALPEVSGGAAMLVDPFRVDDIASALRSLIERDGLRAQLGRQGCEHSRKFTWERAVRETWSVYGELLD